MSTSGSVDSGGYQGRVLRFSWGTNSTNGNTRNIWYKVEAVGGSSSIYYHHNETVDLNGTRIYTGSDSHSVKTGDVLASGNMNINQDSTSTLTVSMHGGIYNRTDNINTTQSWTLDTLIQAPTINSLSVKSRTINTITFSFSCSKADNWYYKLSSTSGYTQGSTTGVTSGEFTITGLNPNTSYTVNFIARNWAGSVEKDATKNVNGTTYDIAKLVSVPDVNIGSKQTITWTNPSGATTTLKLCKTDNSTIIDVGTVTGTSKDYTANASTIYALTPNSNEYTARYILTTTQNSKSYTNSKDFKFKVTNSNPTFSNFTYKDVNNTTVNLTGNDQILIKGYSNVRCTVSTPNKAVAKNSATMKNYRLVLGSKNGTNDYSDTEEVLVPKDNAITNIDSATMVMYATDSRGNSTSVTKTAEMKEYTNLTIKSMTVERDNNGVGTTVTLKFNGSFWNNNFGLKDNSIKEVKYQYKETSSSDYQDGETELTITTNEGNYNCEASIKGDLGANGFDVSKSYNIRLIVSDELITKNYDIILGSGTPAIAIYKSKVAIGGKYDTSENSGLQVNKGLNVKNDDSTGSTVAIQGVGVLQHWTDVKATVLSSSNEGTIYFRPNGNTTNQAYIDKNGTFTAVKFSGNASSSSRVNSRGNITAETGATKPTLKGISMQETYNNGYPISAGNVLNLYGGGASQLLLGWEGSTQRGRIYYRSLRDTSSNWSQWGEVFTGTTLYDNSSGTTGTITLSESAVNFTYLEIFSEIGTTKIVSPNGKTRTISCTDYSDTLYQNYTNITISGTSIVQNYAGVYYLNTNHAGNKKIYKVIGYR